MTYRYTSKRLEQLNFHPAKIEEVLQSKPEDLYAYIDCPKDTSSVSTKYWTSRGWSPLEASIRSKQIKKKFSGKKSPFSVEFWIEKGYSPEEALFERNSRRPINPEYWMRKDGMD